MIVFGGFLLVYSIYSMVKPEKYHLKHKGGWISSIFVGATGGVIGGFTAFPGAAVVVWTGLHNFTKANSRSIVQPYILGLQVLSLVLLAVQHPETFSPRFWTLFALTVPVVLPGTLLGVNLYRSLSDHNFRRVAFILLGVSGVGLLIKAVGVAPILGFLTHKAAVG